MTAVVEGATVGVLLDLGEGTLVIGRDEVGDVMSGPFDSLSDIGCEVVDGNWSWGADAAHGPLTETDAGRMVVTVFDPDATYDPANAASPVQAWVRPGRGIRVTVDGTPAWTGRLTDWSYSHAERTATLDACDALDDLTRVPVSFVAPAGTAMAQARAAMDAAGLSTTERATLGTSTVNRSSHRFDDNVKAALDDCRFAELGSLYVDREGRIVFAARDYHPPGDVRATIGCGVAVQEVRTLVDPASIRNLVRVDRFDPEGTGLDPVVVRDDASIALYRVRPVTSSEEDLDLA